MLAYIQKEPIVQYASFFWFSFATGRFFQLSLKFFLNEAILTPRYCKIMFYGSNQEPEGTAVRFHHRKKKLKILDDRLTIYKSFIHDSWDESWVTYAASASGVKKDSTQGQCDYNGRSIYVSWCTSRKLPTIWSRFIWYLFFLICSVCLKYDVINLYLDL